MWSTTSPGTGRRAEVAALRRDRERSLPRLLALAEGRGNETEATRQFAAATLGQVDRDAGFRAILPLLESRDPRILAGTLGLLAFGTRNEDEGGNSAAPALDEATIGRLDALLDHPDRRVALGAAYTLCYRKPPGAFGRLRRSIDDPDLKHAIRQELADDQPIQDLDDALAILSARAAGGLDQEGSQVVGRFARSGSDPHTATRAREALRALQDDPALAAGDRRLVEDEIRGLERRDEALASRPDDLERASAAVDRIVAAGLIDPAAGREAMAKLRAAAGGNWHGSSHSPSGSRGGPGASSVAVAWGHYSRSSPGWARAGPVRLRAHLHPPRNSRTCGSPILRPSRPRCWP